MPTEIEAALLAHPAVAQAAAFAIPHATLGEAVATAVIVKPDQTVVEAELRSFLVERLAYFKIPSKFIFVSEIPRNRHSKIEHLKLPAFFGLDSLPRLSSPDLIDQNKPSPGSVEAAIFQIWSGVLRNSNFGLDHNFFDLGGSSLEGAAMVTLVQERFVRLVTVTTLVEYPTLRQFSLAVRRAEPFVQGGPIQTLQDQGSLAPLFILHGAEGYGYHYHDLAKLLAPDIPVYAFTSIGRPGEELLEFEIPRLAQIYIVELRKIQLHGPYRLTGHSSGGLLALEMAAQLQRQGEEIEFLGMFDSKAPKLWEWYSPIQNWFQRNSITFVNWLAAALQPEAYAFFSAKVGHGTFSEELLLDLNWLEATWYLWQYLRGKTGRTLPLAGTLPGKIIRRVPVKYRTKIWNLSKWSVWHQAQEIINYLQAHPESLQQSELKLLVRAAWQALHMQGLALYRTRPYHGKVVIFQAQEQSVVVLSKWQRVVKGPIRVHQVKGNHGTLVRVPYSREVYTLLRRYLQP